MSAADWSAGLTDEAERIVALRPAEPLWSENLLFALHDARTGLSLWLHLGTVPTDWHLWEDRLYAALPAGGGALSMVSYHATRAEDRPGGAAMAFRCLEPFRRWRVACDGFAFHTTLEAMDRGDCVSHRRRLRIEAEVRCVSPVWDAASDHGRGRAGMAAQSWAREHYEQLVQASGWIEVDGERIALEATGWRDHSRGPRGSAQRDPWGGHVIAGCVFPDGRQFLFSRYWRPDGTVNLSGGMVIDPAGVRHEVEVVDAPRLERLVLDGEELPIHLRWRGGELRTTMRTLNSIWIPRERKHAVGRDLHGARGDMYVLNWGPVTWDGVTANAYLERSAHLAALPARIGGGDGT